MAKHNSEVKMTEDKLEKISEEASQIGSEGYDRATSLKKCRTNENQPMQDNSLKRKKSL